MGTICGRYVATFAEADTGLLQGVSMNAPYPFFWVHLLRIEGDQLVCTGAGEEMRLPIRRRRERQERASVTIQDPIFGPQKFDVAPMLQDGGTPIGAPQADMFAGAT